MQKITINIHRFAEEFGREYQFLYDNYDHVAGYYDAVDEFDSRMKHDKAFNRLVNDFAAWRGDLIVSDRECAAFMFAFSKYEPETV